MGKGKKPAEALLTKVKEFSVQSYPEGPIIYGLGEDGIIYECVGGWWLPLPILGSKLRPMPVAKNRSESEAEEKKLDNEEAKL